MNDHILAEIQHDNASVLATVIKVEGSAYRKQGTMMLFTKDQREIGMLSVGCLEEDVRLRVQRLNQGSNDSQIMVYDMSREDDLGWGRGAGCQGKIHVLLEKIAEDDRRQWMDVQACLQRGLTVHAVKKLDHVPGKLETNYYKSGEIKFNPDTQMKQMDQQVYIHTFTPKKRMILFGAGKDVLPLADLAVQSEFDVFVWDWRDNVLTNVNLPGVKWITDWYHFSYRADDNVIIMTHDFAKDREILRFFVEHVMIQYLGVMGPRKRTKRLLESDSIPNHIHSPVGLAIGAEGPVEIAISIMADVIGHKRGVWHGAENSRYLSGGRQEQPIWDK